MERQGSVCGESLQTFAEFLGEKKPEQMKKTPQTPKNWVRFLKAHD